jgi:hypothetical protein
MMPQGQEESIPSLQALTATHHRAVIDNPAQPKICFLPEKYLVGATTQRADV